MLTINNKKFAECERDMIESLFVGAETCVGYAKRLKHSIRIMDLQKNPVGFVNREGVVGTTTRTDDGKLWHSYGQPEIISPYDSISAKRDDAERLSVGRNAKNPNYLIFK